ncbi:5095_t:CDS:10 [Acaulospora colombiana]|uniref:5095_t:CDS:1 n=1 Tax=Acaulospora colombiana TaxID=27376 RepID=A0ACA9L441_9GLOM|nr:5095_t:CDS:10 [Acaulospora colombiana]
MSSHKAKVNDGEQEDSSSESFVVYGTEIPFSHDSSEQDKGKFQPLWKQEVRDEQGLRRFHGAFKGGWSAGWTPSSFVSSRHNRSERKTFEPKDFMDEEDLEELEQNRKLVTTEEFDSFGSTERELERKYSMMEGRGVLGTLSDKFIEDIVLPSKEPIGMRLLKAMGWREGQGIGPRVIKRKKLDEGADDEDIDSRFSSFVFAPSNTEIISFDQKNNTYGLGFDPYKNAPEFLFLLGTIKTEVLDYDDDGDLYAGNSMKYYHTSLMEDEDMIVMGNRKNPKSKEKKTHSFENKLCHDGSSPLKGFMLSRQPVSLDKWFSPPTLPPGFTPFHHFDSPDNSKNVDNVSPLVQRGVPQKQTTLAIIAEQRGALLGEVPLNAPSRSVFDYVSRSDKERLGNLIGFKIDTTGEKHTEKSSRVTIPKVEKEVALEALKGYIPFEENKKKQARYKQFLEAQAEMTAIELLKQPEELTSEEYAKELDEFAQAARIFRPISKMMASRFTSSKSSSDEFKQPISGIRPGPEKSSKSQKDIDEDQINQNSTVQKEESAAETAARMNMFGILTRTTTIFYPNRLLCKRFNVANPHPEHKEESYSEKTQKGQKEALSKETMDDILLKQNIQPFKEFSSSADLTNNDIHDENSESKNFNQAESKLSQEVSSQLYDVKEVDVQRKRPAMELFEFIFGSSDSEDDKDKVHKNKEPPNMIIGDSILLNPEKNNSPVSTTITDETSTIPFRPMFKKRSDRANDLAATPSTELINSKSYPKIKGKDHSVKGSLSFDDFFVGPAADIAETSKHNSHTSEDKESSSDESDLNLLRTSERTHSHKHSSKKRKTEKKKKHAKDSHASSKKKSKKRLHKDDSDYDEKHRKTKKKKRAKDDESYERKKQHRDNDASSKQEVKLSTRSDLVPVIDKNAKSLPESQRGSESSATTNRKRNRPRAMDLW